jgi:hypothetical protein
MLCQAVLKTHEDAIIRWPLKTELAGLAKLVQRRSPLTANVIGFVDGLAIPVECPSDRFIQNAFYDGYSHETTVNNVIFFGADGKVKYAAINYPGSTHDAEVARSLAAKAMRTLGDYAICVDKGFVRSRDLNEIFVGPLSTRALQTLTHNAQVRAVIIARHDRFVSLRQAAEWGMRGLQGTFARLKTKLTSNKRKRHDIILAILLLHNFRTTYVGFNQIQTVFSRLYTKVMNINRYDRIERYYAKYLMLP